MMEEFYKWRKIWFSTIVKSTLSMLSCEQYGMEKLKTHGLAIWVSERLEYDNLQASKAEISQRATKHNLPWDVAWWNEATAFKVAYVRLVPWDHLITMLECFPMEASFLKDFRTLCPPDKIRIVAFVAPSFLSYDSQDISQRHLSSQVPPPVWTFPEDSEVPTPVPLIQRIRFVSLSLMRTGGSGSSKE
ncbi:hypothetical protein CPB86DRAFT_266663 [Serendipita vermifera]|nr:hypothetical protein CPB86DRAFT_266663 [Serendipita vermifera]